MRFSLKFLDSFLNLNVGPNFHEKKEGLGAPDGQFFYLKWSIQSSGVFFLALLLLSF